MGTRGGARGGREGAGAVAEVVDPASRTWKRGFGVRAAGAREGPRPRRRGASGPRLVLRKSGLLPGGPPWTPKCCDDRGGGGDGRERVLRVRGGGGVLLLQVELQRFGVTPRNARSRGFAGREERDEMGIFSKCPQRCVHVGFPVSA